MNKKREEDLMYTWQTQSNILRKLDEGSLFDISKIKRKEAGLNTVKIGPNKPIASELIVNKPKDTSVAGDLYKITEAAETEPSIFDKIFSVKDNIAKNTNILKNELKSEIKNPTENTVKLAEDVEDKLAPAYATASRFFDTATDVTLRKPLSAVSSNFLMAKNQLEELGKQSANLGLRASGAEVEKREYSPLRAAEKWEEDNLDTEYIFSTKNDIKDYFSFKTSGEKRKEILDSVDDPERREWMKENLETVAQVTDFGTGIVSGVMTGGLSSVVKAAKPGTFKNVMNVFDKTINPSLNNMAKLGVISGGIASANYLATGKWMFEDNEAAQEGLNMFLLGAGIKGLTKTPDTVKWLLNNNQFNKGVRDFVDNFANTVGAKANIVEDVEFKLNSITPEQRTVLFNKAQSIKNISDTKYLPENKEIIDGLNAEQIKNIEELEFEGIIKFNGLKNKKLNYEYTDEGMKLILGEKNYSPEKGKISIEVKPSEYRNAKGIEKRIGVEMNEKELAEFNNKNEALIANELDRKKAGMNGDTFLTKRLRDLGYFKGKDNITFGEYINAVKGHLSGKVFTNTATTVGRFSGDTGVKINSVDKWFNEGILSPAARKVRDKIEGEALFGKNESVKETFSELARTVNDEYTEFSRYLFAKSRLQQSLGFDGDLKTTVKNLDGKRVELTDKDLAKIVEDGDSKYSKLSQRIYDENIKTSARELESGLISKEEYDSRLANNPYYIRAKNTDYDESTLIKGFGFTNKGASSGSKKLVGGSETADFSIDAMKNSFENITFRNKHASTNAQFKAIVDNGDVAIPVEIGKKAEIPNGYEEIVVYRDGEPEAYLMPKYVVNTIVESNVLSKGIIKSIFQTPAQILKEFATGPFNLVFQGKQVLAELTSANIYNKINGGSFKDYLSNLFRNKSSLINTPQRKAAVYKLLKETGGDFTRSELRKQEFDAFWTKEDADFLKKKESFTRKGYRVSSDFWSKVERATSRMPLFEANLKKQGVTQKEIDELVALGDSKSGAKFLEEKGFNPKKAGQLSRDFFDFTAASKAVNGASKYIPYLNIWTAGLKNLDRAFETNPNNFIKATAALSGVSALLYQHNSGTGMFENKDKQEAFAKLPDWVKYSPGLLFYDYESGEYDFFNVIGNNIPQLDFLYTAVVDGVENGAPSKKTLNQAFKTFTFAGDLERDYYVDPTKFGPIGTVVYELATGKDAFYGTEFIKDYEKKPGVESEEYNDYTNPLAAQLARAIASIGGEETPSGTIIGGTQISPVDIERFSKLIDPTGKAFDAIAIGANKLFDVGITDKNVKEFKNNLITKTYKFSDFQPHTEEEKLASTIKTIEKNKIKDALFKAKSKNELKEIVSSISETYKSFPDYEEVYKPILLTQIKNKEKELLLGETLYNEVNMSSQNLAIRLQRIFIENGGKDGGGNAAVNKKIKELKKGGKTDKGIQTVLKLMYSNLDNYYNK